MNETGRRRDFVGYGNSPPAAEWPNGARVAINVVINYEEGSEPSSPDSDAASEAGLTEGGGGGPRSEGNGAVSYWNRMKRGWKWQASVRSADLHPASPFAFA